MTRQRVVVVGAGIGGLVSALELAAHGVAVTVLERAARPGGKLREVVLGGRALDAGPTVFTMRWVFDALFDAVGARLDDHLVLQPLSLLARHAWTAEQRLDLFADVARSADAIGSLAGPAAARGYLDFCRRARRVYATLEQPFMAASRPSPLSLVQRVGLRGLPDLLRIAPMTTLWRALGSHFSDPRLRQLFGRYATYCGSSPFSAPGTLMLVAHVEQAGVWQVQGGMHRIAEALAGLAQARGAVLRYGCDVQEVLVRDGRACGVRLASRRNGGGGRGDGHGCRHGGAAGWDAGAEDGGEGGEGGGADGGEDGEVLLADAVVFNGDVAALAHGRLGEAARGAAGAPQTAARSLSAVTWNLVARTGGFPLAHHTAFFSADYAAEFADIRAGRLPAAPTVYVCAQDRGEHGADRVTSANGKNGAAGENSGPPLGAGFGDGVGVGVGAGADATERLLLIVNAPARGDTRPCTPEELARCDTQTFSLLQRCGLQVQRQPALTRMTAPQDFDRLFPATGGALYGQASHGWTASFSRPGARSRLPRLYLAGGSVHPGPGVPMAALSGRQAAASVLADLVNIVRRPPVQPQAQPRGRSQLQVQAPRQPKAEAEAEAQRQPQAQRQSDAHPQPQTQPPLHRPAFDAPVAAGGYAWWYLDALSDDGRHGLTIIAFIGSVFSPYYALARRRAAAAGAAGADPLDHCALNVALYATGDRQSGKDGKDGKDGKARGDRTAGADGGNRWAMTERGRDAVERDARRLRIGPSALTWHGDGTLVIDIDEITVPWPARIRGTVTVTLPRRLQHTLQLAPGHRWSPIAPVARVAVDIGNTRWSGAGYLDSNHGDAPLERAFRRWDWSRAHLRGGHGAVLYDVEPLAGPATALGLHFDADGGIAAIDADGGGATLGAGAGAGAGDAVVNASAADAVSDARGSLAPLDDVSTVEPGMDSRSKWSSQPLPPTLWRVPRQVRADRGAHVQLLRTLTDAPFYARSLIRTQWLGEPVTAVHESLSLTRFDTAWVQAMLPFRMPRRAGTSR